MTECFSNMNVYKQIKIFSKCKYMSKYKSQYCYFYFLHDLKHKYLKINCVIEPTMYTNVSCNISIKRRRSCICAELLYYTQKGPM